MILKSNHSKSQFKSFSKLSNEDFFFNKSKSKYENNNNNEDNDNENDDNSFLSEYLNIFNSTPCKNFLDRHHLYLRNSSIGLKISNIIYQRCRGWYGCKPRQQYALRRYLA